MANLLSVKNNEDGQTCIATLDGAPSGSFAFHASRAVGSPGNVITATPLGGNQYSLAVASGAFAIIEVLYWIEFTDLTGTSGQIPVFIQDGTSDTLTVQISKQLQSILIANKAAIDLRLAQIQPEGAPQGVQQVIAGTGQTAKKTPAIYIAPESMSEEWMYLPLTSVVDPSYKIVISHFHNGNVSWRDAISAAAWAIRTVLNQSQYADQTLPGGTTLTKAMCTNVVVVESQDGSRYEMSAEISWSCELGLAIV